MTFNKYPLKTQIILGLIFTLFNILVSYTTQVLQWPFFMDMIFVYAGSFFGIPCGFIVGILHSVWTIFFHHNFLYFFYSICCITGTLLTILLVTRHEDFSLIRLVLLFFLSSQQKNLNQKNKNKLILEIVSLKLFCNEIRIVFRFHFVLFSSSKHFS